jgi:hypothetical protein
LNPGSQSSSTFERCTLSAHPANPFALCPQIHAVHAREVIIPLSFTPLRGISQIEACQDLSGRSIKKNQSVGRVCVSGTLSSLLHKTIDIMPKGELADYAADLGQSGLCPIIAVEAGICASHGLAQRGSAWPSCEFAQETRLLVMAW